MTSAGYSRGLVAAAIACAAFVQTVSGATLTPGALFNDNMVLQRDRKVAVWGEADPGAEVTVSFAGQSVSSKADGKGAWRVDLSPMKADATGRELRIVTSGGARAVFANVVVGEVWLCGGQSNMTFQMWPAPRVGQHAGRERNGYYDVWLTNEPDIRGVQVPQAWSAEPKGLSRQRWIPFTPGATGNFSGAAFHYAIRLHQALRIPIGVVVSAWGGTRIEPWTPACGFEKVASLKDLAARPVRLPKDGKTSGSRPEYHQRPRALYNAMIHPLAPYAFRGAIWYQGESNRGDWKRYYDMLRALHQGWSEKFENPDMPFFLVQIAPYGYAAEDKDDGSTEIREEMERFAAEEKNCGLAVISDVGEIDNIHPGDKCTVGTRLAALALNRIYGRKELVCDAPKLASVSPVQNGKVTLSFSNVGAWVMNGIQPLRFEFADAAGKYVAAKSRLVGNRVELTVPGGMVPVRVTYMRKSCWFGFLKNEAGLPMGPFRAAIPAQ